MVFLTNLVFNFHSGIYITTTFLANVYLMQNMKKKPIKILAFVFFLNIRPTLAQILPRRLQLLYFFG